MTVHRRKTGREHTKVLSVDASAFVHFSCTLDKRQLHLMSGLCLWERGAH